MAAGKMDDDLDLGLEPQNRSNKKLIIILAGVVLLLVGGLAAAWFLFLGGDGEQVAEEGAKAEPQEQRPAFYHSLDPVFVVNLPAGSKSRLLQVGLQLMAREPALIDFVRHNDPMIRHTLLNLLGAQDEDKLYTRKGKESLQQEVVKNMNQIVQNLGGPGEIEAVYFTSFVMQ